MPHERSSNGRSSGCGDCLIMRGHMMRQPLLVSSLISHAARWHGATPVVSRGYPEQTQTLDWAQVEARARRLMQALARLGVRLGDTVATLGWNHHRHLEAYYAIPGMGAICHTLNPRLAPEQLAYMVRAAGDRGLLVDPDCLPWLEHFQQQGVTFPWVIVMAESTYSHDPGQLNYETLLAQESGDLAWPHFSEETAAGLCFTSGTTGLPKGVLYSHRSIVLHAMSVALPDSLGFSACTSALPVVPLFHANAWGFPHAAALVGAKLVLPGPWLDGASLYSLMEQEEVTLTAGVPAVWRNLMAYLEEKKLRLHHLRCLGVGGSACPESLIRYFESVQGVTVKSGWGMTETSPVAALMSPQWACRDEVGELRWQRLTQSGRPPFGVDMRLVDDQGYVVAWDGQTAGHLQVRGPWIASHYWQEPPPTETEAWLATGDVATLDGQGYLQITDRAKDLIKSGGEWISSVQIEQAALRYAPVSDAAVIAVPDARWGERPLLLVVGSGELDLSALRAHLAQILLRWWLPERIEVVDSLPYTSIGKMDKKLLRQRYQ